MNKYGYRVDITHPFVEPLYRAYRQRIGNYRYPLSDQERLDFEREFLSKYPEKMPECECYDWDRKNGYHK